MKINSIYFSKEELEHINVLAHAIPEGTFREEQIKKRAEARIKSRNLGGHQAAIEPVTQPIYFDATGAVRFGTVEFILGNYQGDDAETFNKVVDILEDRQEQYDAKGTVPIFGDKKSLAGFLKHRLYVHGGTE